jgi:hypothetical protein
MEEKKQLKNFKCQNPDCGHEFMADEFEARECPNCQHEEITPLRPSWTKYFGIGAIVIIAFVLIILFLRGCSGGGTKLELEFVEQTCELKAFVDDKENQSYVYVLDSKVIQFEKSTFKEVGIGDHTVCIFKKDNFEPNSNQDPIACKPIFVSKSCDGSGDKSSSPSGQPVQSKLQILGIKPGKLLIIDFVGGTGSSFEFSITGMKGPFQKTPDFPNAQCKVYQPGDLVVKCISDGQYAENPIGLRFDGCKQVVSLSPLPPAGPNSEIQALFDGLISGSAKIGDAYGINPGNMSEPIQVFHPNNSSPESIPFYDYVVRLTADKSIKINKVTAGFKWGIDSKGKQVPVPKNIKVYEGN